MDTGCCIITSKSASGTQNPESRTQNPEPRIQNPEPRIQNPEPRTQCIFRDYQLMVNNMERKFLLPSEFHSTKKAMNLDTLLGSCVSICLYNKSNGFASMNHFLLDSGSEENMKQDPGKYGLSSCSRIIKTLMTVDNKPSNYTAQVFGGGKVNSHLAFQDSIGDKNVEMAENVLKEHRIRVAHRDVGGLKGRKISFDTSSNKVVCRIMGESEEGKRLKAIRDNLSGRKLRILVVDDSATVRKVLTMAVNATNDMEVVAQAENPYEAREKLLEHDPDVMLLDIIMPRMNGLDFLKKITKYLPKPVVIVSTIAKAGSDIARRAREYGAMEIIDKDELKLYEGMDVVHAEMIPKIRRAMRKFVPPQPQ